MQAKHAMTPNTVFCTRGTSLRTVEALLSKNRLGSIPVVKNTAKAIPVGLITCQDLSRLRLMRGFSLSMAVSDCMSQPAITADQDTDLGECCRVMEEKRIKRLLIIDGSGICVGILAQADAIGWVAAAGVSATSA